VCSSDLVGKNLPVFAPDVTIKHALSQESQADQRGRRPGAIMVMDKHGVLAGIFTDGDLRRLLVKHGDGTMLTMRLSEVMTADPRRLTVDSLVRDAVQMIREHRIDEIPVVDHEDRPVGLLDVQDLVALKVIDG